MGQEQVRKQSSERPRDDEHALIPAAEARQRTAEHRAMLDETADLLDEIDGMLEEDAQAFVEGFKQRGGE